jgi:hypothetical protein
MGGERSEEAEGGRLRPRRGRRKARRQAPRACACAGLPPLRRTRQPTRAAAAEGGRAAPRNARCPRPPTDPVRGFQRARPGPQTAGPLGVQSMRPIHPAEERAGAEGLPTAQAARRRTRTKSSNSMSEGERGPALEAQRREGRPRHPMQRARGPPEAEERARAAAPSRALARASFRTSFLGTRGGHVNSARSATPRAARREAPLHPPLGTDKKRRVQEMKGGRARGSCLRSGE